MSPSVLITVWESEVAPRFDLTTEVMIFSLREDLSVEQDKTIVLAHASNEDLCRLILTENVNVVICGGIEEEFYEYLTWKGVRVLDSILGPWDRALERVRAGSTPEQIGSAEAQVTQARAALAAAEVALEKTEVRAPFNGTG